MRRSSAPTPKPPRSRPRSGSGCSSRHAGCGKAPKKHRHSISTATAKGSDRKAYDQPGWLPTHPRARRRGGAAIAAVHRPRRREVLSKGWSDQGRSFLGQRTNGSRANDLRVRRVGDRRKHLSRDWARRHHRLLRLATSCTSPAWVRSEYPRFPHHHVRRRDWQTEGNPGSRAAWEAAKAVQGLVAMPRFKQPRADKDSTLTT